MNISTECIAQKTIFEYFSSLPFTLYRIRTLNHYVNSGKSSFYVSVYEAALSLTTDNDFTQDLIREKT